MNQIKKHVFEAVSLLTADNGLLEVTIIPAVDQPDWLIPSNLILDVIECHERLWTYMWQNQEIAVFHLIPKDIKPATLIILEGNTDVHRVALQTIAVRELHRMQVRISNVKDTALPEEYLNIKATPVASSSPVEVASTSNSVDDIKDEHDDINHDGDVIDDVNDDSIDDNKNKNSDNNDENKNSDNIGSNGDKEYSQNNENNPQTEKSLAADIKINEHSFDEHLVQTYTFQCVDVNGDVYVVPDLDKIAHHLVDLDG